MLIVLSNSDKLRLLLWKNFCVALKKHRRIILAILVPPIFCLILVMLRFLVKAQRRPLKEFRSLTLDTYWDRNLRKIEEKRAKIRIEKPDFNHNVFVPQLILGYAPKGEYNKALMEKSVKDELHGIELREFPNCAKLREQIAREHYFAGVCLIHVNDTAILYLDYEIIFPSELRYYEDSYIGESWNTHHLWDMFHSSDERQLFGHDGGYVGYIREGFASIQNAIAMSYLRIWNMTDIPSPKLRRFSLKSQIADPLIGRITISLSLILICGFMFPVADNANMIIKEKETEARKVLKNMGVYDWIYFLSWFVKCFFSMALSSIMIVAILKIKWSDGRAIFNQSSPIALLFVLWAFNLAATSFSIMMSSFFKNSVIGVPWTCIIWLASYLPYVAYTMQPELLNEFRWALSFSCNTVLGCLLHYVVEFETVGDGFDLTDLGNFLYITSKVNSGVYLAVMYLLCLLYLLIAVYIEKKNVSFHYFVIAWNYIFHPEDNGEPNLGRLAHMMQMGQTRVYEIEPEYRKVILKIENVTKVYDGMAVVRNVNFNLTDGDITVVMGHNGAGKTTLLLMLAGMIEPTRGKITVLGYDAKRYQHFARKRIGVCFQDGILFPDLSVMDQLILFGRLRGLTGIELHDDVDKYLNAMRLTHRKSHSMKKLSNGEQRFLSVCCALVGNSKIVLLDDPSKGLDAFARKSLWELLRNERKHRTILLTTHSEEETEALGDRVAVLSGGELKCFGSTFFLKKIYGQGHRLICYKGKNFNTANLTKVIQRYIPNITTECELGNQVSYILEDIRAHPELFDDLEQQGPVLNIQGITISEIDTGDIFLRMGSEDPSLGDRTRHMNIMNGMSIYTREYQRLRFLEHFDKLEGVRLFLNHCEVVMIKRLLNCMRLPLLGILTIGLPIVFTIFSFTLLHYKHHRQPLIDLQLRLRTYPESISVLKAGKKLTNDNNYLDIYDSYEEILFWLGKDHLSAMVPKNQTVNNYILHKRKQLVERINNKYLIGAYIENENVIAYFNNYPLHTIPITLNLIHYAFVRGIISSTGKIFAKHTPLAFVSKHNTTLDNVPASIGNYLAVNISLCSGLIWSLAVLFLVRERREHFKLLQFLSGIRSFVFWLNNFAFDFGAIVLTSLIIMLTISVFGLNELDDEEISGAYFLILIFSGICMCSANYLISAMCDDPVDAYIAITMFNICGTMTYWCYLETYSKKKRFDDTYDAFEFVAHLLPHFSLCNALVNVYHRAEQRIVCADPDTKLISIVLEKCKVEPNCCKKYSLWHFQGGLYSDLIYIFIYGIFCWVLLIFNEKYAFLRRCLGFQRYEDEDPDEEVDSDSHYSIAREKSRVRRTRRSHLKEPVVICDNLGYRRKSHEIVKKLSFQIKPSECFVLLGHNGCGKSTLMKMLVGRLSMTYGEAFIGGINLKEDNLNQLYKRMGYCPQDELCLPEYTVFEIMRMVSLLRGISNHDVVDTCFNLAKVLGFYKHIHKRLSICTPGIRRRFYCACALIGDPKLILLDEATSCIDLAGRRQLWYIICKLRERNHSIIFSSVITQDCETIADRVAIMLNGRFSLVTDPWSLNHELFNGYLLKMKVKRIIVRLPETSNERLVVSYRTFSANPFLKLATFIENEFPMSRVKDQLGNIVVYFIPKETTTLTHIFEVMQRNAFLLYVEDFEITRSALSVIYQEAIEEERYRELQALQ